MALINCPECGSEISDKAISCPHCGYPINVNNENVVTSISDTQSIEPQNTIPHTSNISRFKFQNLSKGIKIVLATLISVCIVVIIALSVPFGDEAVALRDCKTLKSMCKVPSSFEVYEAIVNHDDDYGVCSYITYGAENSYGAKLKSTAIFSEGDYLGEYGDDESDFSSQSEYDHFLLASFAYQWHVVVGNDEGLNFINTSKLNRKL